MHLRVESFSRKQRTFHFPHSYLSQLDLNMEAMLVGIVLEINPQNASTLHETFSIGSCVSLQLKSFQSLTFMYSHKGNVSYVFRSPSFELFVSRVLNGVETQALKPLNKANSNEAFDSGWHECDT